MKDYRTHCSRRRGISRFSFSVLAWLPPAPEHGRSELNEKKAAQINGNKDHTQKE